MLITKEFHFHAAHFLTDYHWKCEKLHGHTYKLQITLEWAVMKNWIVVDFSMLKKVVENEILSKCEHWLINDFIKNPTAENMVIWMWDKIKNISELFEQEIERDDNNYLKKYIEGDVDDLKLVKPNCHLFEIKLWETETSFVTYRGV